jgi:hypothetical protein
MSKFNHFICDCMQLNIFLWLALVIFAIIWSNLDILGHFCDSATTMLWWLGFSSYGMNDFDDYFHFQISLNVPLVTIVTKINHTLKSVLRYNRGIYLWVY